MASEPAKNPKLKPDDDRDSTPLARLSKSAIHLSSDHGSSSLRGLVDQGNPSPRQQSQGGPRLSATDRSRLPENPLRGRFSRLNQSLGSSSATESRGRAELLDIASGVQFGLFSKNAEQNQVNMEPRP